MALRCPVLFSEYIGSDSCAVCRRDIARKRKYECPRAVNRWVVAESCFNLMRLMSRARAEAIVLPKPGFAISGDGMPDRLPVPVPAGG